MRIGAPRTLRARITLMSVAVLLVATAAAGLLSTLLLRRTLLERLDRQLQAATVRFLSVDDDGDADDVVPGQPVGTLDVVLRGSRVVEAEIVGADGRVRDVTLPTVDVTTLAAVAPDRSPSSVKLADLDDYRVLATDTDGGAVQITGLSQEDLDTTLGGQAGVEAGPFAVVIALGGLATAVLVGRTLRPLAEVTATAREVAGTTLTDPATPFPAGPRPRGGATEIHQLGTAFDQMLDHVRDALTTRDATEARLRQFVADASHELRTPLAAVRVHADLATRGVSDVPAPTTAALERVEAAAGRMTALVEDLLLLARLDGQTVAPNNTAGVPDTVDLTEVVAEVVVESQPLAPGHHWRLDLPDLVVEVPGDRSRWHQAVANLVGNARTHTPPGTTVDVALVVTAGVAVVTVADDGPGIPEPLIATVFDRFTRGDAARTRESGGAGLGLAISRAVAESYGGGLTVTSRAGGTRFVLRVPVAAA